jgi:hypothetical protein
MAVTTPRIKQIALVKVEEIEPRYAGYHEDLVNALDEITRQHPHETTATQRREYIAKLIEKLGTQAIGLAGGPQQ